MGDTVKVIPHLLVFAGSMHIADRFIRDLSRANSAFQLGRYRGWSYQKLDDCFIEVAPGAHVIKLYGCFYYKAKVLDELAYFIDKGRVEDKTDYYLSLVSLIIWLSSMICILRILSFMISS